MSDKAAQRRTVAFAMFASCGIVAILAILIYTSVIDVGEDVRLILVGVLALTAVVDVFMGWRFLSSSSSSSE